MRAWVFYAILVLLSLWPASCNIDRSPIEPADPQDTGIAVRDSYPDIKPPRLP